ncbi:MAG: hypothetical protein KatS3mg105_4809 [Gemmatales bacterium]|nr:MAG: hypothetical protein KatS3mg105_4809 [Gemmatales bacterium]
MPASTANTSFNLGFLTIVHEPNGYLGGYLVTNRWGRPLEFRLSTPVQPNRIQQILYGSVLQPYLCSDLIGKTLVEKTTSKADLIFTDCEAALDLRKLLDTPVLWLADKHHPRLMELRDTGADVSRGDCLLFLHPLFVEDAENAVPILDAIDDAIDLDEPFSRVREAIGEARKLSR